MKRDKIHLAILWHYHQPLYKNIFDREKGAYFTPWVRLHCIRNYFSMALLLKKYPLVHLTCNFVPSLLWQIEDYVHNLATDRELELSLTKKLSPEDKDYILMHFFDIHHQTQIYRYPGYKELLKKKQAKETFTTQDFIDLKMWFNLSWFGEEFKEGEVVLPDSSIISVKKFIEKDRGFNEEDISQIIELQYKIMHHIIPIYKTLQDSGQIEISTSPFYHPIIPLIYDTNQATIDKEGLTLPPQFSRPEDARAQIDLAVEYYSKVFNQPPRGMWPSEGAVSQSTIHLFAQANIDWIASDQGVLQKSGKYGYETWKPEVLCQPYVAIDENKNSRISIFFRETNLSNAISFTYQGYKDYEEAANEFISQVKGFADKEDRILTVILDGENPWDSYRYSGIEFLNALYKKLSEDENIITVTFSEYIEGNAKRGILPHSKHNQKRVYDLFCASWIDQAGSRPGNDLGTWIGDKEKNAAWELLLLVRNDLEKKGITPNEYPQIFDSLYAAEGSDWFWWYGGDYSSNRDNQFDRLFKDHLKNVYLKLGLKPLDRLAVV